MFLGGALCGGYWYLISSHPDLSSRVVAAKPPPVKAKPQHRPETKQQNGFAVGGVTFGMTPAMLRDVHPAAEIKGAAQPGSVIGTFRTGGADYTVWFHKAETSPTAYRIRYSENLPRMDTDAILIRFGRLFGQPLAVDCRQTSAVAQKGKCRFKWMIRGGVDVEVRSHDREELNGEARTILTVTATDTVAASRGVQLRESDLRAQLPSAGEPRVRQRGSETL